MTHRVRSRLRRWSIARARACAGRHRQQVGRDGGASHAPARPIDRSPVTSLGDPGPGEGDLDWVVPRSPCCRRDAPNGLVSA
jgi:hypothetical protein